MSRRSEVTVATAVLHDEIPIRADILNFAGSTCPVFHALGVSQGVSTRVFSAELVAAFLRRHAACKDGPAQRADGQAGRRLFI